MRALIDGDILRYEIGFAAETGWRAIKNDPDAPPPPFDYVRDLLNQRIGYIRGATGSWDHTIFLTEGDTFRHQIGERKEYKATRKANKPWHYDNLSVYMKDVLNAQVVEYIEADDAMAIEHLNSEDDTIICSRDKDLRQVPGWLYSWELGRQPAFGPMKVDQLGAVELSDDKKKLTGWGYTFFVAQVLVGDSVDNIPGLPKMGPVGAYSLLSEAGSGLAMGDTPTIEESCKSLEDVMLHEYERVYGDSAAAELTEQARLCWMVRRFDDEGNPVLWEKGMYE